ncbi:MAG: hypothetical protein COT18_04845 [Elusimicrobia bacterium CG08_land_8_20_14_0_20_59_10]|nr:MAG: hypothetical protein COT18_04845 [Elusimicrobia bacterium CG08_land_8_20_14_0_20_59_10]
MLDESPRRETGGGIFFARPGNIISVPSDVKNPLSARDYYGAGAWPAPPGPCGCLTLRDPRVPVFLKKSYCILF